MKTQKVIALPLMFFSEVHFKMHVRLELARASAALRHWSKSGRCCWGGGGRGGQDGGAGGLEGGAWRGRHGGGW